VRGAPPSHNEERLLASAFDSVRVAGDEA